MTRPGENQFLLVYGSQTGQAKAIAEEIAEKAPEHGLEANMYCISLTEKKFWFERESCVVIVMSTTGDGEAPDTAQKFWRRLKKKTLPSNHLENLHYALLGLGDSNYTSFCQCGRMIDNRLQELSAKHLVPPGWADDAVGLELAVEPWMDNLWPVLRKHLNLAAEENCSLLQSVNKDISSSCSVVTAEETAVTSPPCTIPNGITAQTHTHEKEESQTSPCEVIYNGVTSIPNNAGDASSGMTDTSSISSSKVYQRDIPISARGDSTMSKEMGTLMENTESLTHSLPPLCDIGLTIPASPPPYLNIEFLPAVSVDLTSLPYQNACPLPSAESDIFMAPVTSTTQLTSDDALKKTLMITLDIADSGWNPEPGDTIGVVCQNPENEVTQLLDRLGLADKADQIYKLSVIEGTKKKRAVIPPHIPEQATLRHILKHCCDIREIPKKALLRSFVESTSDEQEVRRLQELCSRQGGEHYTRYLRGDGLTLMDVLLAFPTCMPSIQTLLEHFPRLQPRPYSIASSTLSLPGRASIVFNIVDVPALTPSRAPRSGICTKWLDSCTLSMQRKERPNVDTQLQALALEPSMKVPVYLRNNQYFRQPEDLAIPIVMIGPGTGVAPFIGFLQHRQHLIQQQTNTAVGETWLLFGCRHPDRDYIFRKELASFQSSGSLSRLLLSFSRDDTHPSNSPRYVQDNIRKHAADLCMVICDKGAKVYVCGDAKNMAPSVFKTFREILQSTNGLTEDTATSYLMTMIREKRYVEDIWT